MPERSLVPDDWVRRLDAILSSFPECPPEQAWVGTRWRVRRATVAHVFGGEDQQLRLTLRAEPDEVAAFEHLGPPYFRSGWGRNVVGMLLPPDPQRADWSELRELLTDSYCLQAPARLAARVARPPTPGNPSP